MTQQNLQQQLQLQSGDPVNLLHQRSPETKSSKSKTTWSSKYEWMMQRQGGCESGASLLLLSSSFHLSFSHWASYYMQTSSSSSLGTSQNLSTICFAVKVLFQTGASLFLMCVPPTHPESVNASLSWVPTTQLMSNKRKRPKGEILVSGVGLSGE